MAGGSVFNGTMGPKSAARHPKFLSAVNLLWPRDIPFIPRLDLNYILTPVAQFKILIHIWTMIIFENRIFTIFSGQPGFPGLGYPSVVQVVQLGTFHLGQPVSTAHLPSSLDLSCNVLLQADQLGSLHFWFPPPHLVCKLSCSCLAPRSGAGIIQCTLTTSYWGKSERRRLLLQVGPGKAGRQKIKWWVPGCSKMVNSVSIMLKFIVSWGKASFWILESEYVYTAK